MANPSDHEPDEAGKNPSPSCSFCRKGPTLVGTLIEGPRHDGFGPVYICEQRAELCTSIFERNRRKGSDEEVDVGGQADDRIKKKINETLKGLTHLEREVIKLRYGLGDGYEYTPEEVGRILKIPSESALEIEAKATEKLKSRNPASL